MPNLKIQRPCRKALREGDVFSLRYGESRFLFGRVIALDVQFAGFRGGCIRVHIYRKENNSDTVPQELIESGLLIAPQHINHVGFSRGYMPVVGNIPICREDSRDDVCYFDAARSRFVDESGQVLNQATDIVGEFGMGNYRTMDDKISEAIRLALAKE